MTAIYAQKYYWEDSRLHLSMDCKEVDAASLDEAAEALWGEGLKTVGNPAHLVGKVWRIGAGFKPEEKRYYES